MKYYDAEKLFIGNVGYARTTYKDNKQYIRFYGERIAITKQDSFHLDYYYFDVCSKKKYTDFYSPWCGNGASAIFEPCSLALSIKQNFKNDQQIDDIPKVVKKILKDKKISNKDIKEFVFLLNNRMMVKNNQYNLESDKSYNNENIIKNNNNINTNYSTLLTEKVFKNEPAIGRDDEVNELIVALAQDKKNPVLVGPSGTGKTTIVDQLAYRIQQNNVPEFLKNKKIIEIDLISLLSGTKYSGTLQDKITNLINIATKENALIFIDEIHTTYGAGTHDKSDYDVAAMIKQAIDRQGLKVIGTTTTEEYEKYFSNDSLKRRFEKILVDEPNDEMLYKIINKVFNDYSNNNNIKLLDSMDNIIYTLTKLTDVKHRTWNDKVCNPDLVISIIDRIFADAKVNNQKQLTIENIIYGINSCNRIYDSSKEDAINNLNTIEKPKAKILQLRKGR